MSLNEEVEALRSVPLFAKIEPSKLKLLAFTSERLTFPAGGELFHEGDQGDAAYIILDGQADVVVDTPTGELAVAQVGKNDFVGDFRTTRRRRFQRFHQISDRSRNLTPSTPTPPPRL